MDAIDLVEAAYDVDLPEVAWMRRLAEHAADVVPGARRALCYALDGSGQVPVYGLPVAIGFPDGFARACLAALKQRGARAKRTVHLSSHKVATLSERIGVEAMPRDSVGRLVLAQGARDSFGCIALDAERRGIVLSTELPEVTTLTRAVRARWQLLAVHLGAAHRLRRRLDDTDGCVVEPGGRVVHAEGPARSASARARLRDAVVARDLARTRRRRSDPDDALALWPGLVAGRWSLIDRFERDGRRYVIARRNVPDPASSLALSLRERQVLGHLAQGDSTKVTAYALGIAPSTVSAASRTALLKLGVRTVAEVARLVPREPAR